MNYDEKIKQIELFNKWAYSEGFDIKMSSETEHSNKETHCAFLGWIEKAQAVPEDCVIVPKELHIEIAMKMAKERIFKQSAGNDQVWNELVEQAYKDNLQAEQYRLIRDYREMIKASESGAEG